MKTTQKFSSANTSVNSSRIPAIYGCRELKSAEPGTVVLDYGCGKYPANIRTEMIRRGITWCGYDPYNLSEFQNFKSLQTIHYLSGADIIVCSNVLNVIAEDEIITEIVSECRKLLHPNGMMIFKIYEGNRSGIGKQTKKDCYQRNQMTEEYRHFFEGMKTEIIGSRIIVRLRREN